MLSRRPGSRLPDLGKSSAVAALGSSPSPESATFARLVGSRTLSAVAPVGLGVLLGTAFEPIVWPYVIPISIAGLGLLLRGASLARAGLCTALFGVAFMLTTLAWLGQSVGPGAWIALSMIQGLWFLPLGFALALVRDLRAWPLWSAALWSAVETLRGMWPLGGFPWGRLGMATVDTPWANLLPIAGVGGTGLLLALMGFLLAAAVESAVHRGRAAVRTLAPFLVVAALLMLPALLAQPVDTSRTFTVALVQGGVPGDGTDLVRHHRQLTRNQMGATRQLARRARRSVGVAPDLVVWPENSTAVDPFKDSQAKAAITSSVAAIGRPLLLGAMVDAADPTRVLNQAIAWDPSSGPGARYTKRHPVPFGEYIPFRAVLADLNPRLAAIPRDMIAGDAQSPIDLAGTKVAVAICFDVAFDDVLPAQVRDGAELIVVQTSNAMFTGTAQQAQQFAISRVRALETGRSVVVASTNGISGVIGPDGTVMTQSSSRGTEVLTGVVPLASDQTIAMRLGRAIGVGSVVVAAGATMVGAARRVRAATASRSSRRRSSGDHRHVDLGQR